MTVRHYTDFFNAKRSSAINWVAYNSQTKELFVSWLASDAVSGYANVPPHVFTELTRADSVGSYVAHNIKNKYLGIAIGSYDVFESVREKARTVGALAPTSNGQNSYAVNIELDGALQFEVTGTDIADALRALDAIVSKSLADGASYRVTKVEAK